jgi:hypothetical protein
MLANARRGRRAPLLWNRPGQPELRLVPAPPER